MTWCVVAVLPSDWHHAIASLSSLLKTTPSSVTSATNIVSPFLSLPSYSSQVSIPAIQLGFLYSSDAVIRQLPCSRSFAYSLNSTVEQAQWVKHLPGCRSVETVLLRQDRPLNRSHLLNPQIPFSLLRHHRRQSHQSLTMQYQGILVVRLYRIVSFRPLFPGILLLQLHPPGRPYNAKSGGFRDAFLKLQ